MLKHLLSVTVKRHGYAPAAGQINGRWGALRENMLTLFDTLRHLVLQMRDNWPWRPEVQARYLSGDTHLLEMTAFQVGTLEWSLAASSALGEADWITITSDMFLDAHTLAIQQ